MKIRINTSVDVIVMMAISVFVLSGWSTVLADAFERYSTGGTAVIGEFVYDDDMTATTTAGCTVDIYDPLGSLIVNDGAMSADANGWYSYDYSIPGAGPQGLWPVEMSCGTLIGGDLVKVDKSFVVGDVITSSSTIANAVWNGATRTLTSASAIAGDIWGATTRTLTAFGSLAADVWNDGYAPTRRLTDSTLTGGGTLATESFVTTTIENVSSSIVAEVLANRVLISALNDISAADVWAYGARTLTDDVSLSGASVDAIWDTAASGLSTSGSIGKLIVDNLDTTVSSRGTSNLTAADVWTSATRTLTEYATSSVVSNIASAVWSNATRTLTNNGNDITAADVWNVLSSTLNTVGTVGYDVLNNSTTILSAINSASSSLSAQILNNATLINNLNDITAADVWAYGTRSLSSGADLSASAITAIWDKAASSLSTSGSIGKLLTDNIDTAISTRGISNLTATDVWNAATRTLTDYSTSTIANAAATAVWANGARTLTNYGNDITASDVWNVLTSSLTTADTIGKRLADNVDTSISGAVSSINSNISALNDISAADVWAHGARTITGEVNIDSASIDEIWDTAASGLTAVGSVGKILADNIDATISSRGTSNLTATDVWNAATRTLTDYATSTISSTVASAVWANGTRTLTNYGNDITAADVWNVLSSSLTTVGSIGEQISINLDETVSSRASLISQQGQWTVRMSNTDSVSAGNTYRTKLTILDYESQPASPFSVPVVTLYDADRNIVVSSVPMTLLSTGIYEYTYSVSNGAAQGQWETIIQTQVENGKTITTNDYWAVSGSPAQVIINSVDTSGAPTISANITITNEGLTGYEYQYEWCIVSSVNNNCGGGDDVYHATAAKFIDPGEDWNTTVNGTVSTNGDYYYKLVVYFGTDQSSASRTFSVSGLSESGGESGGSSGGGGGGGGGGSSSGSSQTAATADAVKTGPCVGADLNGDGKVGSTDFSILLYYWKSQPPFKNACVDMNKDKSVNTIDFSIMLSQWGGKGIAK